MRIYTKHIKVLGLAPHELEMLKQMVDEAKAGHTVNYSERQTGRDQYFGISISPDNEQRPPITKRM